MAPTSPKQAAEGPNRQESKVEAASSLDLSTDRRRRRMPLRHMRARNAAGLIDPAKRVRFREEDDPKASCHDGSSSFSPASRSTPIAKPVFLVSPAGMMQPVVATGGGGTACESHGMVAVIGRRRTMEDEVAAAPGFAAGVYDFFGVFDGHGGLQVAKACRERMHVVLAEELAMGGGVAAWPGGAQGETLWSLAVAETFARMDAEVEDVVAKSKEQTLGSTAVVAVVGGGRILVANCGDSRAVLCRAGLAIPLSCDHKPDQRPDEVKRIEEAGGHIVDWNGSRVLGVLATTRSIGDHDLKPSVTSLPELYMTDRTEEDEFIILGSDGLWDVISNEVACKAVKKCLTGVNATRFPELVPGSTAVEAAALLLELAMCRGSNDNVSAVVVELKNMLAAA